MKAESYVFTGAQKPMTVAGISPILFMLDAGGASVMFGICIAVDLIPLALISFMVTLVVVWWKLYRLTRKDHHFANILLTAPRFWRGRKRRQLIAGAPPKKGGV